MVMVNIRSSVFRMNLALVASSMFSQAHSTTFDFPTTIGSSGMNQATGFPKKKPSDQNYLKLNKKRF